MYRILPKMPHRLKQGTFFFKLITTTALIAIVPSLLLSIISYYNVSRTFEKESGATSTQLLNQTINALEIIVNQIKNQSQQLVLNQSFRNFETFPNGYYYESILGAYDTADLPALHSYLTNKDNAIETIRLFKLSNNYVDSVYFYDRDKNLVLAIGADNQIIRSSFDEFADKNWYDALKRTELSPLFLDTRQMNAGKEAQQHVLTIIFKSNIKDNAFIINLDASMVYDQVINKINDNDDAFVVSKTGRIMLAKDEAQLGSDLGPALGGHAFDGGHGSFKTDYRGRQVLVTYAASGVLGWTFVNAVDLEGLYRSMIYLKQVIVWSAVLLLAIAVALSLLSSRRLYRPISGITAYLRTKLERSSVPADGPGDELNYIGRIVRSAFDERDYLLEKLEESLPYYREQFKSSLLRPHAYEAADIRAKLAYLQIELEGDHYMALVVLQDDHRARSAGNDLMRDNLFKLYALDAIEASGRKPATYIAIDADEDKLAIVVSLQPDERIETYNWAGKLLEALERSLGHKCTIGASRSTPDIARLPAAYDEALEAAKYRMIVGSGQVIAIEDVTIDKHVPYAYPKRQEELLAGYIKTGNVEEAMRTFAEIAGGIAGQKLHYNQIMPLFIQLLSGITQGLSSIGADPDKWFSGAGDPYRALIEKESIDAIEAWFRELIEDAAAYIGDRMETIGNQHIDRALRMIERDYGSDLSLQSVSETLNLNPAYVSRLFKMTTGKTFVEYVTWVRMEKSKELLLSGELRVHEIGKSVGYNNAYYFIKVFKEHAGVTPGEYKKLFGPGAGAG